MGEPLPLELELGNGRLVSKLERFAASRGKARDRDEREAIARLGYAEAIATYTPGKGSTLESWAFAKVISLLQRYWKQERKWESSIEVMDDRTIQPDQRLIEIREEIELIKRIIINELGYPAWTDIKRVYLDGMTAREAGERRGIEKGGMTARIRKTVSKVQESLGVKS